MTPGMVKREGVLRRAFLRFRATETGAVAVEFVMMVPIFMMIFMGSFESGMAMVRFVMLERSLDMTVRDLRLGNIEFPENASAQEEHDIVKGIICDRTVLFPNCDTTMMLELQPVSTLTWAPLNATVECVDRSADINEVDQFSPGTGDEMMLVRACTTFDPIFPGAGIGLALPKVGEDGGYGIVAISAFVNEPEI